MSALLTHRPEGRAVPPSDEDQGAGTPVATETGDDTVAYCGRWERTADGNVMHHVAVSHVRLGHARLADALTAAIERHVPADRRLAELRRVNELLFSYADAHASLAPATADPEHARWFVRETLGPLAAGGTRMRELRETLRVYLATERSLRRAADGLHVARNTVTYRVKRAEELLPGSTRGDLLGLHMALEIAQTLPG